MAQESPGPAFSNKFDNDYHKGMTNLPPNPNGSEKPTFLGRRGGQMSGFKKRPLPGRLKI